MVKFVAIYKQPVDKVAFDHHFNEVHAPLCAVVPNLLKMEVTHFTATPRGGEPDIHLMCEMYFADKDAMMAGLMSEAGAATSKDAREFARDIFSGYFAEGSIPFGAAV